MLDLPRGGVAMSAHLSQFSLSTFTWLWSQTDWAGWSGVVSLRRRGTLLEETFPLSTAQPETPGRRVPAAGRPACQPQTNSFGKNIFCLRTFSVVVTGNCLTAHWTEESLRTWTLSILRLLLISLQPRSLYTESNINLMFLEKNILRLNLVLGSRHNLTLCL